MSGILQGKTAVIAGIANRWSLAYAIAQSFAREGASLVLTYVNDKQRETIESITSGMPVLTMLPLDVTKDEDIQGFADGLKALKRPIDVLVHSLAFANREDLSNPFIETSREGFLLAQNVSAYSLVAMTRAVAPLMPDGGSVITLSYLGATRVMPHYNVMGTAKASLESSVRYLAGNLGRRRQDRVGARGEGSDVADGVREGMGSDEAPHGPGRGGRCGGVPRQRPEPRRNGERPVRRRRDAHGLTPRPFT